MSFVSQTERLELQSCDRCRETFSGGTGLCKFNWLHFNEICFWQLKHNNPYLILKIFWLWHMLWMCCLCTHQLSVEHGSVWFLLQIGELGFDDLRERLEAITSILTASQEFLRKQQVCCTDFKLCFIYWHTFTFVFIALILKTRKTWKEVVREDCQARKLNKEDAMDRCKWRKVIKEVRWPGWVW